MTRCPFCNEPLTGLGTFCWNCERYTGSAKREPQEAKGPGVPKDTRSEDERKRDALGSVTMLGWDVLDFEQGFRPFECRHCGGAIAGGTRVPVGTADWFVMGFGIGAWVEWKDATNTQSDGQKRFQDRCKVAGIPYGLVRTTEEVVEFLDDVKALRRVA
jgi:hypothetical protein